MKQTPQQWSLKSSFIYWIQLICFIAAQILQRFSNCLPCGKCFGFFSTIFVEQPVVYAIMWQMYGARCTPDTKCVVHDVDKEGYLFLFTIARNWPLYLCSSSEHGNAHKNAARDNCISTNCSSWFYLARNDLTWKQVLGLITSRLGSKAAKPAQYIVQRRRTWTRILKRRETVQLLRHYDPQTIIMGQDANAHW